MNFSPPYSPGFPALAFFLVLVLFLFLNHKGWDSCPQTHRNFLQRSERLSCRIDSSNQPIVRKTHVGETSQLNLSSEVIIRTFYNGTFIVNKQRQSDPLRWRFPHMKFIGKCWGMKEGNEGFTWAGGTLKL